MPMTAYDVGDTIRLSASFTDAAGAAADPTTVVFTVRRPDGTEDTVANSGSSGNYTADYVTVAEGEHSWKAVGTGNSADGKVASSFYCRKADV